jgi:hypothetical protein
MTADEFTKLVFTTIPLPLRRRPTSGLGKTYSNTTKEGMAARGYSPSLWPPGPSPGGTNV